MLGYTQNRACRRIPVFQPTSIQNVFLGYTISHGDAKEIITLAYDVHESASTSRNRCRVNFQRVGKGGSKRYTQHVARYHEVIPRLWTVGHDNVFWIYPISPRNRIQSIRTNNVHVLTLVFNRRFTINRWGRCWCRCGCQGNIFRQMPHFKIVEMHLHNSALILVVV